MSAKEEEIQRFSASILELLSSEAAKANFLGTLAEIAALRDKRLFDTLKAEGKLSEFFLKCVPIPPPRFEDDEKNIMLYIERNKNKNVVVYRGMLTQGAGESPSLLTNTKGLKEEISSYADEDASCLAFADGNNSKNRTPKPTIASLLKMADKSPLDAYWLDIDPAYVEANRKKGVLTNRCELNIVDRNMAYGVSVKTEKAIKDLYEVLSPSIYQEGAFAGGTNNTTTTTTTTTTTFVDPRIYPVSFVAIPSRLFFQALTLVPTGCAGMPYTYLPVIFAFIDGKLCVAERIYVEAKEGGMLSLPKVQYVDLFGWQVPSSEPITAPLVSVTERLKP